LTIAAAQKHLNGIARWNVPDAGFDLVYFENSCLFSHDFSHFASNHPNALSALRHVSVD
jgi:hypothetical protein